MFRNARFSTPKALLFGLFLSAGLSACGDSENNPSFEAPDLDCNAAGVAVDCFYPFPSDVFRVEAEGGHQLAFSDAALPKLKTKKMRFATEKPIDGYPVHPPILATLGQNIDPAQLTFHTDDTTQTLASDSRTLVIDVERKEAVAHFAELDASVSAANRDVVQIRLLQALRPNARYVVALQNLTNTDGERIPRLESFEHLAFTNNYPFFKDEQTNTRENILPVLEEFGVDLDQVQLAWDFTTRSNASARGDQESIMDQTQTWLDDKTDGPHVSILSFVEYEEGTADGEHPHLRYDISATIEIPLFLESDDVTARMQWDEEGIPKLDGTAQLPLTILISHNAVANGSEAVIQFGHGFFGNTGEMRNGFFPGYLNDTSSVAVGIDWWGLSSSDLTPIINKIAGAPTELFDFTERLQQSFANQTVVARAMKTSLPELADFGTYLQADNHTFYGISLGHILGSSAVALSREINNAVLSVGGGSFSFLMSRAKPFEALMMLVNPSLSTPKDAQKFFALAGIAMEKVDPLTYADLILSNPFEEGVVDRRILAQVGMGDPAVPMLSSFIWTRTAGLPIATPSPMSVDALPTTTLPSNDSALVLFDFSLEGELPGTTSKFPAADNGVHQAVRENAEGQEQVRAFIRDKEIQDTCGGACVFSLD